MNPLLILDEDTLHSCLMKHNLPRSVFVCTREGLNVSRVYKYPAPDGAHSVSFNLDTFEILSRKFIFDIPGIQR